MHKGGQNVIHGMAIVTRKARVIAVQTTSPTQGFHILATVPYQGNVCACPKGGYIDFR